jgi:hypothetical protein
MKRTRTRSVWSRRADDYETLLKRTQHRFPAAYCSEPRLRFAEDAIAANPKRGITDHGPPEEFKVRPVIRVGVIGTPQSIDHFSTYVTQISRVVEAGLNARDKAFDPIVFPDFPGTDPGAAFRVELMREPSHQRLIPQKLLEQDLRPTAAADQIRNVVIRIAAELDVLSDLDPPPDVVAIVMPPFVQDACQHVGEVMRRRPTAALTPTEAFAKTMSKMESKTHQGFLDLAFAGDVPTGDRGFWNFHHALKARAMRAGIPTQLIWERSLRGEQTTQDPASIAWNLMTGLYYKAGNIPWEVEGLPFDTCFLGISFFKSGLHAGAATHTSLAQVFSGHGEGLVMKGGKAIKERKKPPHMDRQTAERLIGDALNLYGLHHPGGAARRLVVHKTSQFLPDEIAGIAAAVPGHMKLDLVSLTAGSDIRFLRSGTHPPLRGTYVKLSEFETLLFTVGYVPEFRQYPGAKNPEPIVLRHDRGDSTRETICEEIMALTKLNWNSCAYASKQPITTLFAEAVGAIMGEYLTIPEVERGKLQTKYRFFM